MITYDYLCVYNYDLFCFLFIFIVVSLFCVIGVISVKAGQACKSILSVTSTLYAK